MMSRYQTVCHVYEVIEYDVCHVYEVIECDVCHVYEVIEYDVCHVYEVIEYDVCHVYEVIEYDVCHVCGGTGGGSKFLPLYFNTSFQFVFHKMSATVCGRGGGGAEVGANFYPYTLQHSFCGTHIFDEGKS